MRYKRFIQQKIKRGDPITKSPGCGECIFYNPGTSKYKIGCTKPSNTKDCFSFDSKYTYYYGYKPCLEFKKIIII